MIRPQGEAWQHNLGGMFTPQSFSTSWFFFPSKPQCSGETHLVINPVPSCPVCLCLLPHACTFSWGHKLHLGKEAIASFPSKRYLSVKVLGSRATRRWALAQGTDGTSDGSWTDRSYHGKQTKGTWTRRGNVVKDHSGIQKFVPLFVTCSEEWQDL